MKAIDRALEKWTEPRVGRWARVLQTAHEEALAAAHTRIGSEHLVLALVVGGAGNAARHLRDHGIDIDALRKKIISDVDERGGDPQAPSLAHLCGAGTESLTGEPFDDDSGWWGSRRGVLDRLSRTYRWTPEALAVLDTATEHANSRNRHRHRHQRNLTDDDLAMALATTRGTRAWDLLGELGVRQETMVAAAESP